MPDTPRPARWAACLPLLACLVGASLLALVLVWAWHLLTPERWHWLGADERGDIEVAGLGLMAAAVAIHARMRRTGIV
ncbi:MAG: hypothetical protein Q4B17_12840, partial [Lautropia sp.]|nr:hypothetical protein [Lautropia sp.]